MILSRQVKNYFWTLLKLGIALSLVGYLVQQGKLDFSKLTILIEKPEVLVATVLGWIVVLVLMISWRWQLLLRGMGLEASFPRVLQLYLIGLFFNSTMPGAVGGDIIKAVYVMRDHRAKNKTPAMLTILLDRIIGLMGLFLIGAVAVSLKLPTFWASPMLKPIVLMIYGLLVFTVVFYAVVFIPVAEERDPFRKMIQFQIPGFGILRKIYAALLVYRDNPATLVYALLISVAVQTCTLSYFLYLTGTMFPEMAFDVFDFAAIYPVGILATALPLAPGGLGVGHVAFDSLYHFIGMEHGADVFNVYLLASITLSLSGIVPYLFVKKKRGSRLQAIAEQESAL